MITSRCTTHSVSAPGARTCQACIHLLLTALYCALQRASVGGALSTAYGSASALQRAPGEVLLGVLLEFWLTDVGEPLPEEPAKGTAGHATGAATPAAVPHTIRWVAQTCGLLAATCTTAGTAACLWRRSQQDRCAAAALIPLRAGCCVP
jgi:hypothetical protein